MDGDGQTSFGGQVQKRTKKMHFGADVSDDDIPLHPLKRQKPSSTTLKARGYIQTSKGGTKGNKSTKKGKKTVKESKAGKRQAESSSNAFKKGNLQLNTIPDNDVNAPFNDKVPDDPPSWNGAAGIVG